MLIVFLFLNSWRSTVITGLTLPIAIIGTFLFMYMLGFSINMITLMALSLCVGLLIDDAIVVRENIVRHVQMGKSAYRAALEGTQEIGLAVLATTLSIVAVFLPIGFMEGIIGKFFHEFGLTIVVAVLISMFVSFTLDPMLSSVWHDPSIHRRDGTGHGNAWYERTLGRLTQAFERGSDRLAQGYQDALAWALAHKKKTLLAALAIFVSSIVLARFLGSEFVPKADFSETSINFNTPVGSSLELTEAKARQVDAILHEWPEVRYTLTTINTGTALGKIYASVYVRLTDRAQRKRSLEELVAEFRERLSQVSGITITHAGQLDVVGGNKQIEFSLTGSDLKELERLSLRLMQRLRSVPGLVDLDSSIKPDKPTLDVVVDRSAAADLGLNVGNLGAQLRRWVAGEIEGNWRAPDDQTYDVTVRLPPTLVANAIAVQEANREYQERALARQGLKRMYIATLTLSLFFSVFGAVLLAAVFGNQLARPLLLIAAGVREVVINTAWLEDQFPAALGDGARGVGLSAGSDRQPPTRLANRLWVTESGGNKIGFLEFR